MGHEVRYIAFVPPRGDLRTAVSGIRSQGGGEDEKRFKTDLSG